MTRPKKDFPFPLTEDLGTYTAEAGKLKAELNLGVELVFMAIVDPGTDWYVADLKFYREPKIREEKGLTLTAYYKSNVLREIFSRLERSEKGLEEMLRPETVGYDWRETREVLKCVLSLEEQTQHIYGEREKAGIERGKAVYGEQYGEEKRNVL